MTDLPKRIEAILFVAHTPTTTDNLAESLKVPSEEVSAALEVIGDSLRSTGLRLSSHIDGHRLVTAPEYAHDVERFMQREGHAELTRPALETLSIVAYRGPISKLGIEAIRGVGSDAIIRNLIGRGLITTRGTSNEPGKPSCYIVSTEFLDHFGISAADKLPELPDAA
jgi:segregation and condensation protein B